MADVDLGLSARRRLREPLGRRLPATPPPPRRCGSRPPAAAAQRRAPPAAGTRRIAAALRDEPEVWAALRTGLRDYVGKNRFPGVHRRPVGRDRLGAHGGDRRGRARRRPRDRRGDAVVALLAGEPGGGARQLAESLAIRLSQLPIAPMVGAFDEVLAELFAGREPDITEENIQARARGTC